MTDWDAVQVYAKINRMSRAQITQILEDYGFAVYDDEFVGDLRLALVSNVSDGTIRPESLDDYITR